MADWRIKARYYEACNCAHGCPCNFNGFPTHGKCEASCRLRSTRASATESIWPE